MESNQEQNESSKIDQQIKMIREEKQRAYNNYVRTKESAEDYKLENQKFQELREKRIMCLTNLRYKYLYMSDPKIMAVKKIQNFLREKYFEPRCVNDDEIAKIPSLYRLRINITNHHINEYSENNIEPELLDMHRIIYKMVEMSEQKYILFRYCFDIRKLYPMRNDLIELYDGYFFMQPDDHIME